MKDSATSPFLWEQLKSQRQKSRLTHISWQRRVTFLRPCSLKAGRWMNRSEVIDFEAPTFCSLLRWIYCDELIFPPGMLVDVVKIAQKYMVHSLISFVTDNFENVDTTYVWSIHTTAIELEMGDLAQKSLNLINSDQATHLASADFLNASCASVTAFVLLDKSSVTELQIFTRCLEWSGKECERQGLEVQPLNQRMVHGAVYSSDFVRVDDGC